MAEEQDNVAVDTVEEEGQESNAPEFNQEGDDKNKPTTTTKSTPEIRRPGDSVDINSYIEAAKEAVAGGSVTVNTYDALKKRSKNILPSEEDMWAEDDVKNMFMENAGGDESKAREEFLAFYKKADEEGFLAEMAQTDKVQLDSGFGELFVDQSWFTPTDYHPVIAPTFETMSGRRQFGYHWTDPIYSAREKQSGATQFLNDQGDVVELPKDTNFLTSAFGTSEIFGNDLYQSKDGRDLVALRYNEAQLDPYARVDPTPIGVYEGEMPDSEIISRWDLSDSLLKSNYLERSWYKDLIASPTRTVLGLAVQLTSGSAEFLRSASTLLDMDDEDFMRESRDFMTNLDTWVMSVTDEDQNSMFTWSNLLDLTWNVTGQLLLAYGTAGTSAFILKGIGVAPKLVKLLSMMNTAYVYGTIAASDIRDETMKAGFSEEAASVMFMSFMTAIGALGSASTMMPYNWEARTLREGYRLMFRDRVIQGVGNIGKNRSTWHLAKGLAKDVKEFWKTGQYKHIKAAARKIPKPRVYGKFAEKIIYPKGGNYILGGKIPFGIKSRSAHWAGMEELYEEVLEVGIERSMKLAWNEIYEPRQLDPRRREGFLTIYDHEFWDSLPAELIMAAGGGYMGGRMAKRMFGLKTSNIVPITGQDVSKKAKLAFHAAKGEQSALSFERGWKTQLKKKYDTGALGSHDITIKYSKEKGRLLKKSESPDTPSVADAVYNYELNQYNAFKAEMAGWDGTYEEFLGAHPEVAEKIKLGGYMSERFMANMEELGGLYNVNDPTVASMVDARDKANAGGGPSILAKAFEFISTKAKAAKANIKKIRQEAKDYRAKKKTDKDAADLKEAELQARRDGAENPEDAGKPPGEKTKEEKLPKADADKAKKEPKTEEEGAKTATKAKKTDIKARQAEQEGSSTTEDAAKEAAKTTAEKKKAEEESDPTTKNTQEEEEAAEEFINELNEILLEEANQLANDLQMDMSTAKRIVTLEHENMDMLRGITAEEDYIISVISLNPELKAALIENEHGYNRFGPLFFSELLKADHRQSLEEQQTLANYTDHINEVLEHVKVAATLEELFDLGKFTVSNNGKLKIGEGDIARVQAKFEALVDELVEEEELVNIKHELIASLGLYNTAKIYSSEKDTTYEGAYAPYDLVRVKDIKSDEKSTGILGKLKDPEENIVSIRINSITGHSIKENIVHAVVDVYFEGGNVDTIPLNLNPRTHLVGKETIERIHTEDLKDDITQQFDKIVTQVASEPTETKLRHFYSFIEENGNFLVKIILSERIANAEGAGQLLTATYDPTGQAVIDLLKRTIEVDATYRKDVNVSADFFITVLDELSPTGYEIDNNFQPKGVDRKPLLRRESEVGKKLIPHMDKWEALKGGGLDTKSPIASKDMGTLLLRDFSSVPETQLTTSSEMLFATDPAEDPGLLEKLIMNRSTLPDQTKINTDLEGAQMLIDKLKIRKAMLELVTGEFLIPKFEGEETKKAGMEYIFNLAELRFHNAKTFSKEEFDAPLDKTKYDEFTKWYAHYIFDPYRFAEVAKKLAVGQTVSEEEMLRYNEANVRLGFIQKEILPAIKTAISVAEELKAEAELAGDEKELLKSYKERIVIEAKEVIKEIGNFNSALERFKKESSVEEHDIIAQDLKIALEKHRSNIDAILNRPNKGKEQKSDLYWEMWRVAKTLNDQDQDFKNAFYVADGSEASAHSHEIRWMLAGMGMNSSEFLKRARKVILPHEPTTIQEKVSWVLTSALTQRNTTSTFSFMKAHERFEDFVMLDGGHSTGKSTVVAPLALKITQDYLDSLIATELKDAKQVLGDSADTYELGKNYNTVLAAAHSKQRAQELQENLLKAGIDVAASAGMDTRDLYNELTSRTAVELADYLDNVAIIAFDEITHIQYLGTEYQSDLSDMLTALREVNRERAKRGRRPIKFLGIGDYDQPGWTAGMPTVDTWGQKPVYGDDASSGSISDPGNKLRIFKAPRLEGWRFRAHTTELGRVHDELLSYMKFIYAASTDTTGLVRKPTLNIIAKSGPVLDVEGETIVDAGVLFINNVEDLYGNTPAAISLVKKLRAQILKKEGFRVAIVDDDLIDLDPEKSPLGALMEEFKDDKIFIKETIYSVQGGEYDYVLGALPLDFLPQPGDYSDKLLNFSRLAMVITRARFYAVVVVPPTLNLKNQDSEMTVVPDMIKKVLEEDWRKFREDLYKDIQEVDTLAPKVVTKKEPSIEVEGLPETIVAIPRRPVFGSTDDEYKVEGDAVTDPTDTVQADLKAVMEKHGKENSGDILSEIQKQEEVLEDDDRTDEEHEEAAQIVSDLTTIITGGDQFIVETPPQKGDDLPGVLIPTESNRNLLVIDKGTDEDILRVLDEEGITSGYPQITLQPGAFDAQGNATTGKLNPYTGVKKGFHYLQTILGTSGDESMNTEDILPHVIKASGVGPEGRDAMRDYTYEVYTYEYGTGRQNVGDDVFAKTMAKTSALVATHAVSDKKFVLALLPSDKVSDESNMGIVKNKQEAKLNSAINVFTNAIGRAGAAPGDFDFTEFNRTQTTFEAGIQLGTVDVEEERGLLRATPDRSYRTRGGTTSFGAIYIKKDVTEAARTGNLIPAAQMGELITGSETAKKLLEKIEKADGKYDGHTLKTSKRGSPAELTQDFINRLKTLPDFSPLTTEDIVESGDTSVPKPVFKETFLIKNQDTVKYTKGGDDHYIFFFTGQYPGQVIPIIYNGTETEWQAFFGITKDGDFIQNYDSILTEEYYTPEIKALVTALEELSLSENLKVDKELVFESPATKPIFDTLRNDMGLLLGYNVETLDSKDNIRDEFLYASGGDAGLGALKFNSLDFNKHKINVPTLRIMVNQPYSHLNHRISISQPILFTKSTVETDSKGRDFKGHTFLLYNATGKYNLETIKGVRKAMKSLDFLKLQYDPNNLFDYFQKRDGLGLIMLDPPGMGFVEAMNLFIDGKGEMIKEEDINLSLIASSSVTSTRVISMFGQLGWTIAQKEGIGKGFFKYQPGVENTSPDLYEHTRLKLLNDAITKGDRLAPVFSKEALNDATDWILKTASTSNPDTASRGTARAFLTTLSYILSDYNLGGLETYSKTLYEPGIFGTPTAYMGLEPAVGLRTDVGEDGIERYKTNRPKTSPILFFPKEYLIVEDPKKALTEDQLGFDLAAIYKLILQLHKGQNQVFYDAMDEHLTVDVLKIFDKFMFNFTMPGTLRQGMFITPAAKLTTKADEGWAIIKDSKSIEKLLKTNVKMVHFPGLLFNINVLDEALNKEIPNKATMDQSIQDFKKEIDDETTEFLEQVKKFNPKEEAYENQKGKLEKEVGNFENIRSNWSTLPPGTVDGYINTAKKRIADAIAEKNMDAPGRVRELSEILIDPIEQFGIETDSELDPKAVKEISVGLFGLATAISIGAFTKSINTLQIVVNGLPKDIKDRYNKTMMTSLNHHKDNLTPAMALTLDSGEQLDRIIDFAIEKKRMYMKIPPELVDETVKSVIDYTKSPAEHTERQEVLDAYLGEDVDVRKLLNYYIYAVPSSLGYFDNPYVRAHSILDTLPAIMDVDNDPAMLEFKEKYPDEYRAFRENDRVKDLIAIRRAQIEMGEDPYSAADILMDAGIIDTDPDTNTQKKISELRSLRRMMDAVAYQDVEYLGVKERLNELINLHIFELQQLFTFGLQKDSNYNSLSASVKLAYKTMADELDTVFKTSFPEDYLMMRKQMEGVLTTAADKALGSNAIVKATRLLKANLASKYAPKDVHDFMKFLKQYCKNFK